MLVVGLSNKVNGLNGGRHGAPFLTGDEKNDDPGLPCFRAADGVKECQMTSVGRAKGKQKGSQDPGPRRPQTWIL